MQIGAKFVPYDFTMMQDHERLCIVTGPNSGGKTTFLRTIGLCVYMAHMGCPIPCDEAVVPLLAGGIFVRSAVEDNAVEGISTFFHEMLSMSRILSTAQSNSLVLIDELGKGTTTSDGFGIAYACLSELAQGIGSLTFAASHFTELASLEDDLRCGDDRDMSLVRNVHMSCDDDAEDVEDDDENGNNETSSVPKTNKFSVLPGAMTKQMLLPLARRVGLPKSVLRSINELLKEFGDSKG